jgi:hypothetical protein
LELALQRLGASVRNADDIYPGGSSSVFRGFALKACSALDRLFRLSLAISF